MSGCCSACMSEQIHLFFFGLLALGGGGAFCLRGTFHLPFGSLRRGFSDGVCAAGLMKRTPFFLFLLRSLLSLCCLFPFLLSLSRSFLMDFSLVGEKVRYGKRSHLHVECFFLNFAYCPFYEIRLVFIL